MVFRECTGNDRVERCVEERTWYGESYQDMLYDDWMGISVRALYNCPECVFWDVRAARAGGSVEVRWKVLYMVDTWGFVIESSETGNGGWEAVSEYIQVEDGNTSVPETFVWEGDVGNSWIRVVEIEERTQNRSESGRVRVVE